MPTVYDHFAVLKPDLLLDQLKVSPEIYQTLDTRYNGFGSHTLIAAHEFDSDWPTWEIHPAGDEMAILLSGDITFVLRQDTGDRLIKLEKPGAFLIVPRNTWHTARVGKSANVLFITPGEGTLNETSPPSSASG